MSKVCALALLSGCVLPSLAMRFQLQDDYMVNNYQDFFSKFSFWTSTDPTHGYVNYVSESDAWDDGLIGNGGNIYLGVDHKNVASGNGRNSVRLTSNDYYNIDTLFVANFTYMPETCGTWPAFWTTATTRTWPQQGEIDIVEEANGVNNNQMSIHLSKDQGACNIQYNVNMTATQGRWGDCDQKDTGGCDANDPRDNSFGLGFNNNGGGVYAMEWSYAGVRIWFFPGQSAPQGVTGPLGSNPDTSLWGTPTTNFEGSGCDFDAHFKQQHIVFDTTFCGAWGSGTWESSGCATKTGYSDCESYVQYEPKDFSTAFWSIAALRVYSAASS